MPQGKSQPVQKNKPKARQPKKQAKPTNQQVKAPVSVGTVGKIKVPEYRVSRNGRVCVRHTELVGDILGSVAFTINSYSLNPGLTAVFIWLGSIANNYESYKFKSLRFRYEPSCATTQVGYVYIGVDFDPSDPPPASEQGIAAYEGTKYGSAWLKHVYDCAKHNLNKRSTYFTRNANIPTSSDIGLYDVGNLYVCTTGNGGTDPIGKLWVEYEVELITPQLIQDGLANSQSGRVVGVDNFVTNPTVTGNAPVTVTCNAGTLTMTSTGPYQAVVNFGCTGTTLTGTTAAPSSIVSERSDIVNTAGTSLQSIYTLNFVRGGQSVTMTIGAATVTGWSYRLAQYQVALG
jgi:hypothetical protein